MASAPIHLRPPFPLLTVQQLIVPPDVVEVTVRIGVVRSTEHLQFLAEVRSQPSDMLVAMASLPHVHVSHLTEVLRELSDELVEVLEDQGLEHELLPPHVAVTAEGFLFQLP